MASASEKKKLNKLISDRIFIGRGGFGDVFGPCSWKDKTCAVKRRMCRAMENCTKEQEACEKWMLLHHKNLITVYKVSFESPSLYILMEFASGGSLKSVLERCTSGLPEQILTDWSIQVAQGMAYLHQHNIVHRDLKSLNVIIMEGDAATDPYGKTLKIIDFDQIREFDHTTLMSHAGTYAWMAPEVIDSQHFSKASDVWSYGVVLWEMLEREVPYKGVGGPAIALGVITRKCKLTVPDVCPDSIRTVLESCLCYERKNRPTFDNILSTLQYSHTVQRELRPLPGFIELTTEPDMITLDDDPSTKRAKMPCGHVIGVESMIDYFRDIVNNGKFKFICPSLKCNCEWEYILVRHVACLSDEEMHQFDRQLAQNFLMQEKRNQVCPGCKTWCVRAPGSCNCVRCPICTANRGKKFYFCWVCLNESKSFWSSGPCGNPACDEKHKRIHTLASCSTKRINLCMNCPSIRGCPKCGLLIEHQDKCGHVCCRNCHCQFCFVCLKEKKDGQWQCHYLSTCQLAPRQIPKPRR